MTGDETDHRLLDVLSNEIGTGFFSGPADLSDHDNRFCVFVFIEQSEGIDKMGSDNRVSSDSNAGRLPDATTAELADCLVGQSATP